MYAHIYYLFLSPIIFYLLTKVNILWMCQIEIIRVLLFLPLLVALTWVRATEIIFEDK